MIYKNLNKIGEKVYLKNQKSIELCLEYSDDVEKLQELISQLEITAEYKGKHKVFNNKVDTMFYDVEIKRGEKAINFEFNQSINFMEYFDFNTNALGYSEILFQNNWYTRGKLRAKLETEKTKMFNDFLYSVLCCIKSDGYITDIFEDFCDDFGYNKDSIKDYKLFLECNKQAKKIRKIFSMQDLECLPQ